MQIEYEAGDAFIITPTDPSAVAKARRYVEYRGFEFFHPNEVEPEFVDQSTVKVWLLDRREEFAE